MGAPTTCCHFSHNQEPMKDFLLYWHNLQLLKKSKPLFFTLTHLTTTQKRKFTRIAESWLSPLFCLWYEARSCLYLLLEPQLSVVPACCCFQATLLSYSHSIPIPPPLPVPCPICRLLIREMRRHFRTPLPYPPRSRSFKATERKKEGMGVTVATTRRQLQRWWGVRLPWRLGNYSTVCMTSFSISHASAVLLRHRQEWNSWDGAERGREQQKTKIWVMLWRALSVSLLKGWSQDFVVLAV